MTEIRKERKIKRKGKEIKEWRNEKKREERNGEIKRFMYYKVMKCLMIRKEMLACRMPPGSETLCRTSSELAHLLPNNHFLVII